VLIVAGHAMSTRVHHAQRGTRGLQSELTSLLKDESSRRLVFFDPVALDVHLPEIEATCGVLAATPAIKVFNGFGRVALDAVTAHQHHTEVAASERIATSAAFAEEFDCELGMPRRPPALNGERSAAAARDRAFSVARFAQEAHC
jgi:hypothetical protein